jgi:hypothetical protein
MLDTLKSHIWSLASTVTQAKTYMKGKNQKDYVNEKNEIELTVALSGHQQKSFTGKFSAVARMPSKDCFNPR